MLFFQLLATLFILVAIHRIITRYRQELIPRSEIVVWLVFWLLVTVAIWWPRGTDILARSLGVSRGVDVIVTASLAAIFYLLFQLFSHVHRLQRELTTLVRALAIKEHKASQAGQAREDKPS
ncbi:MAG: DUF2304 family protein [Parcubacteria group bacterium]|nr:DUF2304 family protein [Parcubacteria group bacterium]